MNDKDTRSAHSASENEEHIYNLDFNQEITLTNAEHYPLDFRFITKYKADKVIINFKNIKYDSYLVVYLNALREFCNSNDIKLEFKEMNSDLKRFVELLTPKTNSDSLNANKISSLKLHISAVGDNTKDFVSETYRFIEFFGELIIKIPMAIFKPSLARWKDFPHLFTANGVNALPISALIVFLIGLVTGYQGASQLKQFGADIFIADLIGISLTRTLVPMLVAILVAGRSGSAFAAEIGTMKVSEEIDALTTMGYDISYFLVIPRVVAVVIAMPLLILICDFVGVAGGMIAALGSLDITMSGFINRLQIALSYSDVFSGVIKSMFFAFLISSIGCFKGLQASGGSSAVGKFTTSSVVAGVFLIILTDAIFTFIFQALGI